MDVDGVGLTRPNLTGLPTRIIRSHWDLGPLFDFDGVRAAKNIALGYMDTMRNLAAWAVRRMALPSGKQL